MASSGNQHSTIRMSAAIGLSRARKPSSDLKASVITTSNTTAQTGSATYSWKVSYDSTNPAQRDIPASCHESTDLTITNGGTISSP